MAKSHALIAALFTNARALALAIGLLTIGSPFVTGARAANLQDLGGLSGNNALATGGVSANGKVVAGELFGCCGTQAFRWVGGTLTPLGFLGNDVNSTATAANSDGSVITGYSYGSTQTAFRWAGGTMTSIGALADGTCNGNHGPPDSKAFAINADGSTIVGQSASDAYCNGEPFRWTSGGGIQGLGCPIQSCFENTASGVSADGTVVVGFASASGALTGSAWRWVGGSYDVFATPAQGSNYPSAFVSAVTPDGTKVVGTIVLSSSVSEQAYIYNSTTSTFTYLGQLLGGNSSQATAVSADGSVVVGYGYDSTEHQQGWIWTAAIGMRTLNSVLGAAGANVSGWALTTPLGISADGTIVTGYGTGPCNCSSGWIAYLRGGPSFTANPAVGNSPLSVTFHASGLTLPLTYTINYGDGMMGPVSANSCIPNRPIGGQAGVQCSGTGSHTYQNSGAYTASLLGAAGGTLDTATIIVGGKGVRPPLAPPVKPPLALPVAQPLVSAPIAGSMPMPERHSLDQ